MMHPEDHPLATPKLHVTSVRSVATTYALRSNRPLGGWALCTINDHTGELAIQSDWGHWAYRWDARPSNLGGDTLTAFLGRNHDVDYTARKLQGSRGGEEFDPDATVRAFCRIIAEFRRRCGRRAVELAHDDDMSRAEAEDHLDLRQIDDEDRFITADAARHACNKIANCADGLSRGTHSGADLFLERVIAAMDLCDLGFLFDRPWELIEHRQTMEDRVLRESILPALFEACRKTTVTKMLAAANGPQPAPDEDGAEC